MKGVNKAQRPLTSSGLILLVKGLLAQRISEWERLRNDNEYVYHRLHKYAQTCAETIKDANGQAQTPEGLLSKPLFVGMRFRITAHNVLLEIGAWSVILEYLRDIEKLDREKGRFGAQLERGLIMSQVKSLLDDLLEGMFQRFLQSLPSQPMLRQYFTREKVSRQIFLGTIDH